jgi:hypothetical protein
VPRRLAGEVVEHPEEFGLADGLSKARALAQLLQLGAGVARENVREARRANAYAALRSDPEYIEATREADHEAFLDGRL